MNPALSTVLVLAYLLVAAVMGKFLVKSFRNHGLLDDTDPGRFQRARVLVVVMALFWPSTLLLGAIVSTPRGHDWVMRVITEEQ